MPTKPKSLSVAWPCRASCGYDGCLAVAGAGLMWWLSRAYVCHATSKGIASSFAQPDSLRSPSGKVCAHGELMHGRGPREILWARASCHILVAWSMTRQHPEDSGNNLLQKGRKV